MSQAGEIDITGTHPEIPTEFIADIGSAIPIGNILEVLGSTQAAGTTPLHTEGSGNTLTIINQRTQAIASADSTKVGLAAFDSASFSVDANGFVTSLAIPFSWVVVTSANNPVNLVANKGYIVKGGSSVQFVLPAAAAIGDTFRILGYGNLWSIAQNAGQSITIGFLTSTSGVTGAVTATMVSDSLELVTVTANLEFYETDIQGNPTLT